MPALRAKSTLAVSRSLRRFRQPHLSYGIAYTACGAFQVQRGIIEAPEEVGARCGWELREDDGREDSPPRMIDLERRARGTRAH
jgi:hypothetical protein